ncbi:hypothetical protein DJICPGNB_10490 [Escherichia coli]|nr:hypothetical protein DJICPGNB_10490 [Escherichia coli]
MLYGFSGVILQGALVTLELAISSVVLAVIIGLIGAGGKLAKSAFGPYFRRLHHADSWRAGLGVDAADFLRFCRLH